MRSSVIRRKERKEMKGSKESGKVRGKHEQCVVQFRSICVFGGFREFYMFVQRAFFSFTLFFLSAVLVKKVLTRICIVYQIKQSRQQL